MSDPRSTPTLSPERIAKVAAGVKVRVTQTADRSARIGRYRATDGTEHEVAIVNTQDGGWEVLDRSSDDEETIEDLGGALEEAVALAVEYRRDREHQAVHERAMLTARKVRRLRAVIAENGGNGAVPSRQAA
jgi:hypothetical protein